MALIRQSPLSGGIGPKKEWLVNNSSAMVENLSHFSTGHKPPMSPNLQPQLFS